MEPMVCESYLSIGDGICDQANDNPFCHNDGGDCSIDGIIPNCTRFDCFENLKLNPCPQYEKIGNGQCDEENFDLICSFDAGDCQVG